VLPVRLALGTAYFDAEAKQGVAYRYRVSTKSPDGAVTPLFVSLPVTWPGTAKLAAGQKAGELRSAAPHPGR